MNSGKSEKNGLTKNNRLSEKNGASELAPRFFDLYSVCSRLITEIGKDAVREWTNAETVSKMGQFIEKLENDGIPRGQATLAWQLLVDGNEKSGLMQVTQSPLTSVHDMPFQKDFTPSSEENVFSFEGGRWVIRFQGKTVYPADVTGIKHLHCLISRSGEMIPPRELYDGFGSRSRRKRMASKSLSNGVGSELGGAIANPDILNVQSDKQRMLDRLETLESELTTAKSVPNADLIESLLSEKIRIQDELRRAFTPAGNCRKREPDRTRRMKAVDIAIRRAKEKIELAGHRSLVIHLDETIEVKVKSGCTYSPDASVKWRTKPVALTPPRRSR